MGYCLHIDQILKACILRRGESEYTMANLPHSFDPQDKYQGEYMLTHVRVG